MFISAEVAETIFGDGVGVGAFVVTAVGEGILVGTDVDVGVGEGVTVGVGVGGLKPSEASGETNFISSLIPNTSPFVL